MAVVSLAWALPRGRGSTNGPLPETPVASTATTWAGSGVLVVDRIVEMALEREPFHSELFFEGIDIACVASAEGAPAPAAGPACGPGQAGGEIVRAVQLGNCTLNWYEVGPAAPLSAATQAARPSDLYAVLSVGRDVPTLGYVSFVIYLVDRSDASPKTLVLTIGQQGVKQANTACGQTPEHAIPTNVDRDTWLVPPPE